MNRRSFLFTSTLVALALASRPAAWAVDVEYEQAVARAQGGRPSQLSSKARIAPAAEPGKPFVIHGRVLRKDGRTPAPDIVVFAYHTDATGRYDAASAGPHSWRLRGWVKTGADGRFEFTTIRPAPYPNRNTAAHVHFVLEGKGVTRRDAGLLFEGDPLLTTAEKQASAKAGRFGEIRPIETRDGVEHVSLEIRIDG